MRTIGTTHGGYFNDRCITNVPFQNYVVKRAPNAFRWPNGAWFRLTGRINHRLLNLHWSASRGGVDLLHLLNGIHLGKQPWLTTYETFLPRWGAYGYGRLEYGLKFLARPNCHRLIALSECAVEIQKQFLDDYPRYRQPILEKIEVVSPPQTLQVQDYAEKSLNPDRIEFTLVGADFFRKGGLEILRACDRLLERKIPLMLNIVSRMQYGDYATQTGPEALQEAQAIIARHPEGIHFHDALPNAEVLELFRRTHVGLLPTWADTYGFSVLEAQAAACPVITTDLRALPEINHADRGWIIPVQKDQHRNALLDTAAQRKQFSLHLTDALETMLENIVNRPEDIATKGKAALAYVKEKHDPDTIAAQLERIYDAILGSKY